jgi:hypothetical protein
MTAVDWLLEELKKFHHPTEAMIMYAKKLEKQQIIDAANGYATTELLGVTEGEFYYNETYGNNSKQ